MTNLIKDTTDRVLELIDAKWPVEEIAKDVQISKRSVYKILQEHRPGRTRIRRCTSKKRGLIKGLLGEGYPPSRVAFLSKTTRQYVYRIQAEQQESRDAVTS